MPFISLSERVSKPERPTATSFVGARAASTMEEAGTSVPRSTTRQPEQARIAATIFFSYIMEIALDGRHDDAALGVARRARREGGQGALGRLG